MKPIHWILLVGLICSCMGNLRAQSCCDRDSTVMLCYLSSSDYCFSNEGGCNEYSLDGIYMKDALREKLLFGDNFGFGGTVECNLELIQLPANPSISFINNAGCDIVFLPSVVVNPQNNRVDPGDTFIPQNVLDGILDWSLECPSHLVIASQGETTQWGYTLANANTNPNQPITNNVLNQIFDGPFGVVNNFEQGGTYQGVFSRLGNSAEILAHDSRERPTIVLDTETNDLMLGDIGIFCNGPGDVSKGTGVITNNDILACNIFALACQIASSTKNTNLAFEECEGPIRLPSGLLESEIGIYSDTLATVLGCDSIVNIEIIPCEEVIVPNIFSPNGDGRNDFFTIITDSDITVESFKIFNRWGQIVYNNQNPSFGWNGQFKNADAPIGVYIYQIVFYNSVGTRRQVRNGDVTLLR